MNTRPRRPARSRLAARALLAATALLAFTITASLLAGAANAEDEDPALKQRIGADQKVATGQVELDRGHVDIAPRYVDGTWKLMVHDDSRLSRSVWRNLEDVLFRVNDTASLEVPGDPAYEFLGAPVGSRVHVVPQTQADDIVWIGWNTQDPGVLARIDRGVTLALDGVEGPGELAVYLQSGTFGEPQVLWDSRKPDVQDLWVDINTHTHANWVFTEPGVYQVRLQASADLVDGTTVTDTRIVRLAVGDAVSAPDAFAAKSTLPTSETSLADAAVGTETPNEEPGNQALTVVAGAGLLVAAVATIFVARSRRTRQQAFADGNRIGGDEQ